MGDSEKEAGGGLALLVAENRERLSEKSGGGVKGFLAKIQNIVVRKIYLHKGLT